jgi:phosphoserine phosphatase RsbU/P
VTVPDALLAESAEDLFEHAPCGYVSTALDGTLLRVNRTFEEWTGHARADLLGHRRFSDLLSVGGRIYHETHCMPLLRMQGAVREIAADVVRADGSLLPVLVNLALRHDDAGTPRVIRITLFDATDRRRYEDELIRAGEREHEVALRLQRSLLAGTLPDGPDVELGIAYRPAVRGQEVGGDWFDAFRLDPPGTIGVVVGDVVGRGIEAAASMGQLRSAVRAFASTGPSPGPVLDALDAYSHRHEVGEMATVVYAQIDLTSGRTRYACAGHLPPLLAEPGLPARYAWDGRSLPLDAQFGADPRPEGVLEVAERATLLLYTDGLVERRDRSLGVGLDDLRDGVERHRDLAPGALTDALVDGLTRRGERADDVCVVAVRRTGRPAPGRA